MHRYWKQIWRSHISTVTSGETPFLPTRDLTIPGLYSGLTTNCKNAPVAQWGRSLNKKDFVEKGVFSWKMN